MQAAAFMVPLQCHSHMLSMRIAAVRTRLSARLLVAE
jgi:hypothetical protein